MSSAKITSAKMPRVSVFCGSETASWSDVEVQCRAVANEECPAEVLKLYFTLPGVPKGWGEVLAMRASGRDAFLSTDRPRGETFTYKISDVEDDGACVVIGVENPRVMANAVRENIRLTQEKLQLDMVSRIAELLESKRPARGLRRDDIEEWILQNLPESKLNG